MAALSLFTAALAVTLLVVRSAHGRVLVAIRENEERTRMLGYDAFANKLAAVVLSGAISAAAGAAYALLFGYVGVDLRFGPVLASSRLLWVLLGGAATTLGPLVGTLLMTYVIDLAGSFTSATLFLVVGMVLILLVLFFPKGLLGALEEARCRGGCRDAVAHHPRPEHELRRRPGGATPSTSSSRRARSGRIIGPNGAGKTTFVGLICGPHRSRAPAP